MSALASRLDGRFAWIQQFGFSIISAEYAEFYRQKIRLEAWVNVEIVKTLSFEWHLSAAELQ